MVEARTDDGAVVLTDYEGSQTTVTDQALNTRRTTTDALGRIAEVVENPSGKDGQPSFTTTYGYNALDNLTQVLQGSQTRIFTYDSLGRLTSAANPESGAVDYTYNDNGNLLTRTDPRGTTTSGYDSLNRVTGKTYTDANTPAVNYGYDDCPNGVERLCGVSSSVSATAYAYDPMGRVAASAQTTEGRTYGFSYGYNLAGGLEQLTYPSGRVVASCYDTAGRVKQVDGYASGVSYSAHGALEQMTLANGVVETTVWEPKRLQPASITAVKGATTLLSLTYGYGTTDNNGNVRSQGIAPLGVSQAFGYDALNRLKTAAETGIWSRTYGYDRYGNGWVASNTGLPESPLTPVAESWFNDGANPVTNRMIGVTYDAAGNQQQISPFTMEYDAENRQKTATHTITGAVTTYRYDGEGRRVKKEVGGGANTVYVYDAFGQLAAEYATQGSQTASTQDLTADHLGSTRLGTATVPDSVVGLEFRYCSSGDECTTNNGNVLSQAISVPNMTQLTQFYAYDPVNRLEIAAENPTNPAMPACPDDGSQWCQKFGYDAWGNRQIVARSHLGVSPLEPSSFGSNNRITGTEWGYDPAGNLTKNPLNETFAYDAENRQTAYCTQDPSSCPATPGTGRTLYSYDGEGRRVKKELPSGVATVYLHDASGQLAAEYSTQGSQTAATKYLTADHLGSTRVITGPSGEVLERRDYHAFGEEILVQGGSSRETVPGYTADAGVRQKFTGKERDGESGLDYFWARYMGAIQGRFMSPDPKSVGAGLKDPQSWNGYAYVLGNPLVYVDPNGKWPTYVHNRIYIETFGGIFSAGQMNKLKRVSAGQDSLLKGGQDPSASYTHSMCFPGQSLGACSAMISGFINTQLSMANELSSGGRELTPEAIAAFARAVHALTDRGSPAHTGPEGTPFPWGYGFGESIAHGFSERSESVAWFRLGQSIRYAIAGFVQAFPELAKKQGSPEDWGRRTIEGYVQRYFAPYRRAYGNLWNTEGPLFSSATLEEAARLCALGNRAACLE